ncbi:MAG: homoaconitate hydratase [Candidatus Thermoplasmatota archaeon]|nr:homoaconitate hydratase [Candidatus Thermoplasmatota archaeon]
MTPVPEGADDPVMHNWTVEGDHGFDLPDELVIWDESLRDGEQTPGVYYTTEEKVELAKLLDEIGCDILNCGIPAVSPGELASVKAISDEGLSHASVMGAARTIRSDIDAVLKADCDECVPFIACSDVHLKYKLKKSKDECVQMAVDAVEYSVDHGLKTTFVTEDTVRADPEFVVRLYNAAIEAGATRVLFSDTVGVMTPAATKHFYQLMRELGLKEGPMGGSSNGPEWGFHNHNDFGLGTANALAAFEMGVPCLNTAVNGRGERAGNTSFEEVIMALETLYEYDTGIKTELLHSLSQRVEESTGIPVDQMKPVVGLNAFRHESGIHTHGVLSNTLTYEPMQPEHVGHERRFVFGKHTGTAAVKDRLERAGIQADKEALLEIANTIKQRIESKGKDELRAWVREFRQKTEAHQGVSREEFWRIVRDVTGEDPDEGAF